MNSKEEKTPLDETVDAFGTQIRAGTHVVYYTGDGGYLRRGTVIRIVDHFKNYYIERHDIRVFIRPDDDLNHISNVGHKLCLVEA